MAAQASLRFRSAGGVSTASARVVAAPRCKQRKQPRARDAVRRRPPDDASVLRLLYESTSGEVSKATGRLRAELT